MAFPPFREILRWVVGHGKKERSPFANDQEAYEFCQKIYKDTGGVTPELRRAYEFYKNNFNDECAPASRP